MTGTPEGSTESGFMEKPGIEPATPGLQGIALIHYITDVHPKLIIPSPKVIRGDDNHRIVYANDMGMLVMWQESFA